jgi:hypothetical protein
MFFDGSTIITVNYFHNIEYSKVNFGRNSNKTNINYQK